jgi:hemerythrin-like metal-binding protein
MAYLEWINSLSVGVRAIDDQHKKLFEYLNELNGAREDRRDREAVGDILAKLESYAEEHFALEERYFDEFAFPAASAHKLEHRDFIAKVAGFRKAFAEGGSEVTEDLLVFLKTWLTTHISFSDRKYKALFSQKGLR